VAEQTYRESLAALISEFEGLREFHVSSISVPLPSVMLSPALPHVSLV
jgi:hypothetical protein